MCVCVSVCVCVCVCVCTRGGGFTHVHYCNPFMFQLTSSDLSMHVRSVGNYGAAASPRRLPLRFIHHTLCVSFSNVVLIRLYQCRATRCARQRFVFSSISHLSKDNFQRRSVGV